MQDGLISNYNGLQITGERRSHDLDFQVSYTYSRALDENSNKLGMIVNSYNQRADYGNADNNLPNRFVGSVNYTLPFKGSNFWRPAVSGWQFNGILVYSNGIPFSAYAGTNQLHIGDGIVPRALLTGTVGNGSLPPIQHTLNKWFNTAAFTNVGTGWNVLPSSTATAAISGRNILQRPGSKNVDFSLFKNIPLHEALNLQLRSEFFNLFNTPQFNNPNSTVGIGFGTISAAGSPTTLQRISREVQLAAKVTF